MQEAKALREQAKNVRRIGRPAALHDRPCAQPTRQTKAGWPISSAPERRTLAKKRRNIISVCTIDDPMVGKDAAAHSNISRDEAKETSVAVRLSAAAWK